MTRLFGLETEYGFAAPGEPNREAEEIRALIHAGRGPDPLDLDDAWTRDLFAGSNEDASKWLVETARELYPGLSDATGAGVFLTNGCRLYVDSGHPEFSTCEVTSPTDLVRYVLAGQRILERAAAKSASDRPASRPVLFKTNVDYSIEPVTWGCHESILHRAEPRRLANVLLGHLCSRDVFAGPGGLDPFAPGIAFVLSPRALFLTRPVSISPTDDTGRAIFHLKDESLSRGPYKRLHLTAASSLCSERAMWLRAASTVMIVAMADGGLAAQPTITLADPVKALHAIVRDPTCRVEVRLADGRMTTALALQRQYLEAAEARIGRDYMPDWSRTACEHWRAMLDQLERAPDSVATTLDWSMKRALFGRVLARHGLDWTRAERWTAALSAVMQACCPASANTPWTDPEELLDPDLLSSPAVAQIDSILDSHGFNRTGLEPFLRARRDLFECDLRFGQLGGEGIFESLDREGLLTHHMPGVDDIDGAVERPPGSGRAHVRGEAVRRLRNDNRRFICDWTGIHSQEADEYLELGDPFAQAERWLPVAVPPEGTPVANESHDARSFDL